MGRSTIRATAVLATIAMAFAGLTAAPAAASADELAQLKTGQAYWWGDVMVSEIVQVYTDANNWTPGTEINVQWYLGDDAIPGADGLAYVPVADDMGEYLTAQVTGTLEGYESETLNLTPGTVAGAWMPVGSVSIAGRAAFGQTLSVESTGWLDGTELLYEWWRSDVFLGEGSSHVVTADDFGQTLAVYVTGTKPGYEERTGSSWIDVPYGITPGTASISATTLAAGGVLTANVGTWVPGDVSLRYTWLRNGAVVTLSGRSTYLLRSADEGTTMSVRVTGTKTGFASTSVESNALAIPMAPPPMAPGTYGTPTITGTAKQGKVLTAHADTAGTGWTFSFVWLRGEKPIVGATGPTYTVTGHDAGNSLKVRLLVTRPNGSTTYKNSVSVIAGTARFIESGHLHITGKAKVGKKLRAVHGTWTEVKPRTLTYQWYANGKKIKKATKSTLKITKALVGKKIRVKSVAGRTYFVTKKSTSAATKAVKR